MDSAVQILEEAGGRQSSCIQANKSEYSHAAHAIPGSVTDSVQRALPDSSLTRVWSVIQFTSQVLPPSSENDCSKWGEFVLVFDQINRTRMALPLGPDGSVS